MKGPTRSTSISLTSAWPTGNGNRSWGRRRRSIPASPWRATGLKNRGWISYIDSDFIVTKPLGGLLPFLNSGKAIGAVQMGSTTLDGGCPWKGGLDLSGYKYVNSGLLLLNLDKWRRDTIAETLLVFLEKESAKCKNVDETAINWVLRDDIEYLPHDWNTFANEYDAAPDGLPGEINIHYASGLKPWKRPLPTLSHKIWWLFNRLFVPAKPTQNPVLQPRNLLRYARRWTQLRFERGPKPAVTLDDWEAYWTKWHAG
jgi:lipopolysaccharide biosynthesis glycosyltransferase